MERRLAAILAADVVGYSRLMGDDEEGTLATLRGHQVVLNKAVERFNGRIFGGAGDSVMAEFSSPVQAVRCALEFQKELEKSNGELPKSRRMLFRVGINLGDVMVEGGNLFGDAVNIADRLQGLAPAGGICISDTVHEHVRKSLPFGAAPIGKHAVKNISQPVTAFRVITEPGLRRRFIGRGPPDTRRGYVAVAAALLVAATFAALATRLWFKTAPPISAEIEAFPEIVRATRHFRVDHPAELDDAEAAIIYDRIVEKIEAAYQKSDHPHAKSYPSWRRYNSAPYRSATHGNRFVNNFGNATARAYGRTNGAVSLPVGSVLAKDSFEVTDRGDVLTGPLALMEKMEPGFNHEGRDWRYTMILPDGTLFGTTNGENSERVEFCMRCHIKADDSNDHLYFMPEKYRARFLNLETDED